MSRFINETMEKQIIHLSPEAASTAFPDDEEKAKNVGISHFAIAQARRQVCNRLQYRRLSCH